MEYWIVINWVTNRLSEWLLTRAMNASWSSLVVKTRTTPSSLWPKNRWGGVQEAAVPEYLNPTWAKSNNATDLSSSFSSFYGRETAEICDIFLDLIWKFNRTARRCLGEWSSPASRSWQKNSPSSTTEASGCWPVFTISKRFAHTRS